jgi:phosphatidylglycerol phospholipase C
MASTEPEREPLLRRVPSALAVPPMLTQPGVEKLESPVTMSEDAVFPEPEILRARKDAKGRQMPQCIAHRGYKAKHPENTMAAFRGAVNAGAHALETDVHITKDEVVVLSHDGTLKRCFGKPDKIKDLTWDEIKDLTTTAEPHEHMPRLQDLLDYLAEPELEDVWLFLDIKLDNDADQIMRLLGDLLYKTPSTTNRNWKDRVVLGIWAAKFLPLCQRYLPDFPVSHIGFSISYARHFFKIPHVGFNMLLPTLVAPGGRRFLYDAQEVHHRKVLAWTVNQEDRMKWCIRRKLDGVITDDPPLFRKVCEEFDEKKSEPLLPLSISGYWEIYRIWIWIYVAFLIWGKRFLPVASREMIRKQPKN